MKWFEMYYDTSRPGLRGTYADLSGATFYTSGDVKIDLGVPSRKLLDCELSVGVDARDLEFVRMNVPQDSQLPKRGIGDCAGYSLRLNPIVSDDFLSLSFDRNIFEFQEETCFIPVVFSVGGRQIESFKRYFLAWGLSKHTSIDIDRSDVEYYPKSAGVIQEVKHVLFDASRMPQKDVFMISERPMWVANQKVVDAVSKHRCTGFNFIYVGDS